MGHPWSTVNTAGYPFANIPLGQTWSNLYWLSALVSRRPHLRGAVEIGTWHGALATFLGLHFPGSVLTADVLDQRDDHTKRLHHRLGVMFYLADCHDRSALGMLLNKVPRPALVFVDGGHKTTEFLLVAKLLGPGDVIGVHDIGTEFHLTNEIQATVDEMGLKLIPYEDQPTMEETLAIYWEIP